MKHTPNLLRRLIARPLETALALVLASTPLGGAFANPLNGQVAAGQATIQGQGTATVTITQQSQSTIINWNTFNIAHGELTQFIQPNASSVALNRVTGGLGPSQIYGTIQANGKIFLVNPDGILFGLGSRVDAAGFLATTSNIRDSDFMAGNYRFNLRGRSDASIVNLGHITATNGGFAALVAPGVRNDGVITANLGSVALASGNHFTLDFYGDKLITLQVGDEVAGHVIDVATGHTLSSLVSNQGLLKANGGTVSLTAAAARHVVDSVINNSGVIEANSVGTKNGMIVLGAATATSKRHHMPTQNVVVSGTLSVKGTRKGQTGGTVVISGESVTLKGAKINGWGDAGGGTARISGDNITVARGGLTANGLDQLTLSAFKDIDVDARISVNGGGAVTLGADNTGTGVGTVHFGEGGSIWTQGHVSIFYNPTNLKGASDTSVNALSYTAPTNYSPYVHGDGSSLTAYMLVNTVYDLQNIQNNLRGDYALGRNIDASATAAVNWNEGQGFVPIGQTGMGFTGVFEGLGNTISGLTIVSSLSKVGLFGINSGVIRDVNLTDVSVTANPNLTLTQDVGTLVGLNDGLISNVSASGQVNGTNIGAASVGGLVGFNNSVLAFDGAPPIVGRIDHASAAVSVTVGDHRYCEDGLCFNLTNFAGGLVGYNEGQITSSAATGNVSSISTSSGAIVGGLVGANTGGNISNSYATGSIDVSGFSSAVGGLVGLNQSSGAIAGSYASGSVNATGAENLMGGLVGSNVSNSSITQSYATGSVVGGGTAGGLVGANGGAITQTYASGAVSGDGYVGGLIGFNNPGSTVASSYWDTTTIGIGVGNQPNASGVTGLTTAQFGDTSRFIGWTFGTTPGGAGWVIVDTNSTLNNANGAAGATRPMLLSEWSTTITNAHQLELVNLDLNAHYRLANNINLGTALTNRSDVFGPNGAAGFAPIGQVGNPFTGSFNGQGNTIAGLTIAPTDATVRGIGLFGVNAGTIKDLTLTNVAITANPNAGLPGQFVGTLVGQNIGLIQYVTASGAIDGLDLAGVSAGGLVGQNGVIGDQRQTARIAHSRADVNVTLGDGILCTSDCNGGFNNAGGLVGFNVATIDHSSASGNVTVGANTFAGGLVGTNQNVGTIRNGDFEAVSLAPQALSGPRIIDSSASGTVSSSQRGVALGGLVGYNAPLAVVWNSHATGNVTSTAPSGTDCSSNCLSANVGGLVGQNFGEILGAKLPSSDHGCTSGFTCASGTVTVASGGTGGGLVGENQGIIRNAFATGNVSGAAGPANTIDGDRQTTLGGLVGGNEGVIAHAFATGMVGALSVANIVVGGLVGDNGGTIWRSFASGPVAAGANSLAGGIAGNNGVPHDVSCETCSVGDGFNHQALIARSTSRSTVTVGADSVAGGVTAINSGTLARTDARGAVSGDHDSVVGGLAGINAIPGQIKHSRAAGSVADTGSNSIVAGLVGVNGGEILDSRTRATVSGGADSYVAGLVGINIGAVQDSNASGNVSVAGSGNVVGGFTALNLGTIDPSFASGTIDPGSGSSIVGGFAGGNVNIPNAPNGFTLPGMISTDSTYTGPSSYPQVASTSITPAYPAPPAFLIGCNDALCSLFGSGMFTPPNPSTPGAPPSTPVIDTQPPIQNVIVPANNNNGTQQPTLVNLTTDDGGNHNGGNGNGNGNGGNGGNGNHGNNANNGGPINTGPPPGAGLGRTLDEQRFSGVPPVNETRFLKGELVVQISNTVPMATVLQIAQQLGITLISSQSVDLNGRVIYRFKVANGKDIRILIRALEKNRIIASAQPNYVFNLSQGAPAPAAPAVPPAAEHTDSVPPSAELASEPGLANANTASLESLPAGDSAQYVIDKMHLAEIHHVARGRGVVVAVIDSEIDVNHPDLRGVVVDRFDATQSASHPHPHGTGMAGAIAAHQRLLGVAPGVRLIAIKAFDEQASSAEATSFQILKGLDYAIEHKARVINMSFAGPRDPMMERTLKLAHDKGIILVAAAGNAGPKSPPLYPGADANVIAVTASDYNDRPFAMANRGKYIAVAAPGVDVMVPAPGNTYQLTTGTSVATAHISGVAALLVERKPTITPEEVRAILMRTATPYSARPKGEEDGAGLVDPAAALQALGPYQGATNAPRPNSATLH